MSTRARAPLLSFQTSRDLSPADVDAIFGFMMDQVTQQQLLLIDQSD